MKTRMTHAARAELANAIRSRYGAATGNAKRKILDEFIAASGYHEKSAIRVLNETRTAKERQTRKRPSLYDEASRAALIVLWEAFDRVEDVAPSSVISIKLLELRARFSSGGPVHFSPSADESPSRLRAKALRGALSR